MTWVVRRSGSNFLSAGGDEQSLLAARGRRRTRFGCHRRRYSPGEDLLRHEKKSFLYWWDVWDERKKAIAEAGKLILVQKDTRLRTSVAAAELLPLLTERRRTSRGQCRGGKGNWGLYVHRGRTDEIEIEAGRATPVRLSVQWT